MFKLKVGGIKYSKGEQLCFKALNDKPRLSTNIVDKVYYKGKTVPYNGQKIVVGMLASLRRKIVANKEPFKLLSTKRRGPHPMEFWLEGK